MQVGFACIDAVSTAGYLNYHRNLSLVRDAINLLNLYYISQSVTHPTTKLTQLEANYQFYPLPITTSLSPLPTPDKHPSKNPNPKSQSCHSACDNEDSA